MSPSTSMRPAIGDRFVHVSVHPWSGPGQKGIERTVARIRITHLFDNRFEYVVEHVFSCTNPLPTMPQGCIRPGGVGGIAYGYADELLASGQLRPPQPEEL